MSRLIFLAITVLLGLGAVITATAIFSPYLGLGLAEDFLFWKLAGLSRSHMTRLGGSLCAGAGIILIAYLIPAWIDKLRSLLEKNTWHPKFLQLILQGTPLFLRRFCCVYAPGIWTRLNGNWSVTCVLLPFAVYVSVFLLATLPGLPWVAPDSATYIGISPTRTLLYPLLLRFLAILSDSPYILIWPFLLLGMTATLLFAEYAQRLVRNIFITIPTGLALLFCWPLVEHAGFLLSDYPFYAFYTLTLSIAIPAFIQPNRKILLLLGILIGVTIGIRPVGLVLFAVVGFIGLSHWRKWKCLGIWLVLPLVSILVVQSSAHYYSFGFFAMSKFSGYPWAGNTALMLKSDTAVTHPELRNRIVAFTEPYKKELYSIASHRERYNYLINSANLLIGHTGSITNQYGHEKELITQNRDGGRQHLVTWLNGLSPLNQGLGALPSQSFGNSVWQDEILMELGRQAHVGNLDDFLHLTFLKLRFSWQSVLMWYEVGTDFSHYRTLTPGQADLGMSVAVIASPDGMYGVNISGFNGMVEQLQKLAGIIPLSLMVMASTLVAIAIFLTKLFRGEQPSPIVAYVSCVGAITISYHLMMGIAQIPISRFLVVIVSGPTLLAFLPIAAPIWIMKQAMKNGDG